MSDGSNIEWTDATWQNLSGCDEISPGCRNCYAIRQAHRMAGNPNEKISSRYRHLTVIKSGAPRWTGDVRPLPDQLGVPLAQRRPRRIFVNSLSDTFHPGVPVEHLEAVFGVMQSAGQHTFQVLTKRAERMRDFMQNATASRCAAEMVWREEIKFDSPKRRRDRLENDPPGWAWPPRNVWLGVSVEDRKHGLPRVAALRETPAALRFLSIEPLLEDIGTLDLAGIGWVIVGGESGPGARSLHVAWVRSIVRQCLAQGVPVFVKQLGAYVVDRNDAGFDGAEDDEWPAMDPDRIEHDLDGTRDDYQGAPVRVHLFDKKGGDMAEWPPDLRIREFPRARSEAGP